VTTPPLVVATGAARTYGEGANAVVAVFDASCIVEAGAAIAVVGPSGSGKSTLLHLLSGLDEPTVGSVEWPGLGGHPRHLRPGTVAVIFQGNSLLPALDSLENVAFPLLLGGMDDSTATRTARTVLERLGVADVAALLPEELSGGQAQRVAIARALASQPRLLVADEPTGQLDHVNAAAVMAAIESAAAETGTALVVATHDPAVAARLDLRWEMVDGALRTEATTCSR